MTACSLPWAATLTGRAFPLLDPGPADIDWPTIAEALAKIPRFNGHTPGFHYSVAQHCFLVSELVRMPNGEVDCDTASRKLALAALLHDAHEALIGDITSPVKEAIIQLSGVDAVATLAAGIDRAIYTAAGLPWPLPSTWQAAIKAADLKALATEKRDLMTCGPAWAQALPSPAPFVINPRPWPSAMDLWSERLMILRERA